MKKIVSAIVIMVCMGMLLTGCGSSAEDLVGTWYPVDKETGEVAHKEALTFYETGNVTWESLGESGMSYTVSGDEIQFACYGNVEATATFDISGDRLELNLKKGSKEEKEPRIFEKVQE